ncbi:hypothetical protein CYMTET_51137 [Cymbomonas tetramitiformis]|uniref:Flagellar calcium-binding protein n=1 Tax=Cymbomonas tetramitiformis TaxID=36881 RepID=A0AAE0BMW6_9CHLO|nr:hypothetical protein CYMTET_51137 [Cymbomonas tetramitiformis]
MVWSHYVQPWSTLDAGDWSEISAKLPSGLNPTDKQERTTLFNSIDINGRGKLALSDIDRGVRDFLDIDEFFNCKGAIIRAFHASKAKSEVADDFMEWTEFRFLLTYLRYYFELNALFGEVDTLGNQRISNSEFGAMLDKIAHWGLSVPDADTLFQLIDTTNRGQILFDDFFNWALETRLSTEDVKE